MKCSNSYKPSMATRATRAPKRAIIDERKGLETRSDASLESSGALCAVGDVSVEVEIIDDVSVVVGMLSVVAGGGGGGDGESVAVVLGATVFWLSPAGVGVVVGPASVVVGVTVASVQVRPAGIVEVHCTKRQSTPWVKSLQPCSMADVRSPHPLVMSEATSPARLPRSSKFPSPMSSNMRSAVSTAPSAPLIRASGSFSNMPMADLNPSYISSGRSWMRSGTWPLSSCWTKVVAALMSVESD
jgi:hypothetical protein